MIEYKDSISYGVAFLLAVAAVWLDIPAVRLVLVIVAATFLIWPILHKRYQMTLPVTLMLVCGLGLLAGLIWQISVNGFRLTIRDESRALGSTASEQASSAAIAKLTSLGWTVKPGPNGIVFEVNNTAPPPMDQSAVYFKQISKSFNLHFQQPKNLNGLHYLADVPGCTKIEINAGDFTDISELHNLTRLTSLGISQLPLNGYATVDPSPLSDLTNLEDLRFGSSKIRDSSFLKNLTRIKTLYLGETLLTDIGPVVALRSLETLDIRGTRVTDLRPLENSEHLSDLSIGGEQIPALPALSNLRELKRLSLIEQKPFDLTPVTALPNLQKLFIWGPFTGSLDAAPLGKLIKMRELTLTAGGFNSITVVKNIEEISKLTDLTVLTLGQITVTDLGFVSNLNNLTQINLSAIPVTSIEPLRGLKALKKISLNQMPVTDISPLLDLPALTDLTIGRTPARSDVIEELRRRGVNVTTY